MMAISRQAYFPSLMMTVALIVVSAPAADTQVFRVYEFCHPDDIYVRVRDSYPFVIQSPNFGRGFYPDNVNCSLTIVSGQDPLMLEYYIGQFDLEGDWTCDYVFLTVNGVNICWELKPLSLNFLPEMNSTVLRLNTDFTVTSPDFQILVIPFLAVNYQGTRDNNTTRIPWRGGLARK